MSWKLTRTRTTWKHEYCKSAEIMLATEANLILDSSLNAIVKQLRSCGIDHSPCYQLASTQRCIVLLLLYNPFILRPQHNNWLISTARSPNVQKRDEATKGRNRC